RRPGRRRPRRERKRRALRADDAPDDRDPGALGAPRPRVLHGRGVPPRVPREPLRRLSRLVEPLGADGLQGRARAVQGRPAERPRGGLRDGMAPGRERAGAAGGTPDGRRRGAVPFDGRHDLPDQLPRALVHVGGPDMGPPPPPPPETPPETPGGPPSPVLLVPRAGPNPP